MAPNTLYVSMTVAGSEQKVPVEEVISYSGLGENTMLVVKTRHRTTVRFSKNVFFGDIPNA